MISRYRFAKRQDGRDYKIDCPYCGGKKRFKRLWDEKTMGFLDSEFGACDRENQCGYVNFPNKEAISKPEVEQSPKKITYVDLDIVEKSLKNTRKDPLSKFLLDNWGRQAEYVIKDYLLASVQVMNDWHPIFWLISDKNKAHSGKIMGYHLDKSEPKRNKEGFKASWVHTRFKDFHYSHMAFGSHLVPRYPRKSVKIVESEKTALIMACEMPQYIWLATGSMQSLQLDYLPDLSDKDVTLIPDKGDKAFSYWNKKLEEFSKENLAKSIKISTFVESKEELEEGDDIADYYLNKIIHT